MILDAINALGGWSWVLGLILLGVEVLLPGFFFLWFGIAAILIGISAPVDWPWQLQVVGFVVLSLVTALIARRFIGTGTATLPTSISTPASSAIPSSLPSLSWKAAGGCASMTACGRRARRSCWRG
jgi:membrane-bound ClpP family serine protease